ncbi:MAG: four helix bundle protein [Prevotella sp.]|nr:four helix bundle protein [Prevotella sp.]MBQ9655645.1 four helix bundle protein [Prevotella sp.]
MSDFGKLMEEKCMNFAVRITNLCRFLVDEKKENRISDQLFRSGTSIGANMAEAQCAISKKDFTSKVYISLKECNESLFWLSLLMRTGYLNKKQYDSIYDDCLELKRLLATITKTSKERIEIENNK